MSNDDLAPGNIKKEVYRPLLRVMNGSIRSLRNLERDMPISKIAWMEVSGALKNGSLSKMRSDILAVSAELNSYRKFYWELETRIQRSFTTLMKKGGALPSNSKELESLKRSLPKAVIEGDERIWIFSYDQYLISIAEDVGRKVEECPRSVVIWKKITSRHKDDIDMLVNRANDILPKLYHLKSKISQASRRPDVDWDDIKVKVPKVELVDRPIRRFIIVKKPIPIMGKKKTNLRRVIREKIT